MKFGMFMQFGPSSDFVYQKLESLKVKMADGLHLENRKIAISPKAFDQFRYNFA